MLVAIAGGHGKIGMELTALLSQRGDRVLSLIRNPDHSGDVRDAGAEPVTCDLETDDIERVTRAIDGADAVVFVAGAGPGSSVERKESMDYGGAVKLIEAAEARGVPHYVMISSMGANPDHEGDEAFDVYLRAKGRADAALAESGLDHTIVRPGMLTDEPGTGRVFAAEEGERGEIPRADVAVVLAAVLSESAARGKTFELVSGQTPIEQAVAAL